MKINRGYRYLYKNEVPKWLHCMLDKYKHCLEHRVIMAEFLRRPLQSHELIHHKDENKLNNHIDNLELITRSEHQKHHLLGNDYGKYSKKWEVCLVCGGKHHSKGLCSRHHPQFWRRQTMSNEDIKIYFQNADEDLARELYTALPVDHQYLFEYCIKDN